MSDCILWEGSRRKDGYGRVTVGTRKREYAHRWVWEQANGPLGELELHHLCGNTSCVNLDHLVALTKKAHAEIHGLAIRERPCRKHGIPRTYEKKSRHGIQMACPVCIKESQRKADKKRSGRKR